MGFLLGIKMTKEGLCSGIKKASFFFQGLFEAMSNPEVAAAVQTAIDEAKERAANRSTAGKAEKALKFLADKRVQLLAEIVVATAVRQFPLKK